MENPTDISKEALVALVELEMGGLIQWRNEEQEEFRVTDKGLDKGQSIWKKLSLVERVLLMAFLDDTREEKEGG